MTDNSYAEYWNVIMQSPDFDFVSDIRGLKYGRLYSIYELFEEWKYSDERLAILRLCYTKKPITDEDIQEWKDWHKEEEEEEEEEQCECCDNIATESFDGVPCCKSCYDNGVEYYRSEGVDITHY